MNPTTQNDLRNASAESVAIEAPKKSGQGFTGCDKLLLFLFLLTLPFANPWVRGDGVGYYAFARAILIGHNLDFQRDWLSANPTFRLGRIDGDNHILSDQFTRTGHLDNHFSVGPAILWAPFFLAAHAGVLTVDKAGGHIAPNGYSRPYLWAMALGTAIYGFLGLWISFRIARKYFAERWALLATLGIWFGSSLPVYMYFNPSWSHAQSAFTVALFIWYWDRTRGERSWGQWALLGAIGGLMMDVYYITGIVLLLPLLEIAGEYGKLDTNRHRRAGSALLRTTLLIGTAGIAFIPTLISKKIIYGSYLVFGYGNLWNWKSPALLKVLFSADHGLLSWTPILGLGITGLFFLCKREPRFGACLLVVFVVYVYAIGCYADWTGISSFGNRFFISLTPLFIVGLAAFFHGIEKLSSSRRVSVLASALTAGLVVWNCGLIFQWGAHLIPSRGPISWREAAFNQVAVVPAQAARTIESYMVHRRHLMDTIERSDLHRFDAGQRGGTE